MLFILNALLILARHSLGALTILNIGIRAIPFEDGAVIVAHGLYTEQEPPIVSVVPAQAYVNPTSLARIQ
jgi:hypothetical protein